MSRQVSDVSERMLSAITNAVAVMFLIVGVSLVALLVAAAIWVFKAAF